MQGQCNFYETKAATYGRKIYFFIIIIFVVTALF